MKKYSFWLRLLLGISLFALLFYTVDIEEFKTALRNSNPIYIAIAYAIGIVDRVLMAYKWNILLRVKGIAIPLYKATTTYLTSTFLGLFLPTTVGGDGVRAYAVAREGYASGDVISSVVMERILGMIALMLFVMGSISLSIFWLGQRFFPDIDNLFWTVTAFFVLSIVLLAITFNATVTSRGLKMLSGLERLPLGKKILKLLNSVTASYVGYSRNKRELGLFFAWCMVENLFPIAWTYLLARAFQIEVQPFYFFILVPIVLILRRLPLPTPDGAGIHEGAFVYLLSLIGVAAEKGLLLGIATHLLVIALVLPGGVFFLLKGVHTPIKEQSKAEIPAA
ncbi:MAG: lysylphosphatidylglycerol synthase transmembrane domain-containing protein [Caldilineaceae bacterium]